MSKSATPYTLNDFSVSSHQVDMKAVQKQPITRQHHFLVSMWILPFSLISRAVNFLAGRTRRAWYYIALTFVDSILFMLNMIPFTSKSAHNVVPSRFAPNYPPSFVEMPVTWIMCAIAKMAPKSISESDFIHSWSHYSGVGHAGEWESTFRPPSYVDGDSRCPCPAINALANHGILPHSGRHITPNQMIAALSRSYNLAPTIASQLLFPFDGIYADRGWFDLEDIGAQGLVQHDGSMVREDINSRYAYATVVATQAQPSQRLINRYYPETIDPFGWADHARALSHRRQESRSTNGAFVLNAPLQYIFGSGNAALTHKVIGGRMSELRPWLGACGSNPIEKLFDRGFERIPDHFTPKTRRAWGITILEAQFWTLLIEGAAGPLWGQPRFVGVKDDRDLNDGWTGGVGQAGAELDVTGTEKSKY